MIPINRSGNCGTDLRGSGLRSCDIKSFGDVIGFNLHQKGFSWDVETDELSEATWLEAIQGMNIIPYNGIYDFTQDTPENERSTSSRGIMNTIREGKPQMSFSLTKGGCLHKSLYDKKGDDRWDLSIVFETGILIATNEDDTQLIGFDMGMFDVETFRLQQGTDPQQTTAVIQLVDSAQFNTKFTFITWAELGVNLSKIGGVVDASLTYPTAPAAGTTFSVSVASLCNLDDTITSLDDLANWELGGEQTSPTEISAVVYNSGTKAYDFTVDTPLVATDTIQPRLVDGAFDVAQDTLGYLFKGQAPLATIS